MPIEVSKSFQKSLNQFFDASLSTFACVVMPRAEPREYGSLFVCVCVHNAYLSNCLQQSAEISNTSRSRYFMKIKLNRFVIEGLVFELRCDLLT